MPSNVPLQASGPDLAAAVSNAGGIGVIGPPFLLPSAHICRCFRHGRPRSTDTAAWTGRTATPVAGGVGYTPKMLRSMIQDLKAKLARPDLPFGVDLLIPQARFDQRLCRPPVSARLQVPTAENNARRTNKDYTGDIHPMVAPAFHLTYQLCHSLQIVASVPCKRREVSGAH